MVHVKKCPLGKRGKPTTEFYKDGKPQIYCMGWLDKMNDDPLPVCQGCPDFYIGQQCYLDSKTADREDDDA